MVRHVLHRRAEIRISAATRKSRTPCAPRSRPRVRSTSATCATAQHRQGDAGCRSGLPRRRAQAGALLRVLPDRGGAHQRRRRVNVIDSAIAHGVERVVCLVDRQGGLPINAMGMSKALMEKVGAGRPREWPNGAKARCRLRALRQCDVFARLGDPAVRGADSRAAGRSPSPNPQMTRFLCRWAKPSPWSSSPSSHAEPGDIFVKKAPACTIGTLAEALLDAVRAPTSKSAPSACATARSFSRRWRPATNCARAEDLGELLARPHDARDLNYALYFAKATSRRAAGRRITIPKTPISSTSSKSSELLLGLARARAELGRPAAEASRTCGSASPVHGPIGFHLRCRLRRGEADIEVVCAGRETFESPGALAAFARGLDAVVHLAGVNRAAEEEDVVSGQPGARPSDGRTGSTRRRRAARRLCLDHPCDNDNAYGRLEAAGGRVLSAWAARAGAATASSCFPHLYGEYGRPHYNSAVATFAWQVADGEPPAAWRRQGRTAAFLRCRRVDSRCA